MSDSDHVAHRLDRLEKQLDKLDQTCDEIMNKMNEGLTEHARLEEVVNQTITRIEEKITTTTKVVDGKINGIDDRLESLEKQVKLLLYVIVAITATSPFVPELIKKLVFVH